MADFEVPLGSDKTLPVTIDAGRTLYVLGANGSGKSTLLARWARETDRNTLIAGNREIVFKAPAPSIGPGQATQYEESARHHVRQDRFRAYRSFANDQTWLDVLLSRLSARIAYDDQQFRQAAENGQQEDVQKLNAADPRKILNGAMHAAGLKLSFALSARGEFDVRKDGIAAPYGIDQMSDGERSAFILTAMTILSDNQATILVDEPERHLHRSISSPLLRFLREVRADLGWVVATHDTSLPRDDPEADVLLLFAYDGQAWTAERVTARKELRPEIADAIHGARERVLFVEGTDTSLDLPLYAAFFPGTTILPVGPCRHVLQAVRGLRDSDAVHRMEARGIVDRDNRTDQDADNLKKDGVHPLGMYSVEAVYYHPSVIAALLRSAGTNATLKDVTDAACAAIDDDAISNACKDAAYKRVRDSVLARLPDRGSSAS